MTGVAARSSIHANAIGVALPGASGPALAAPFDWGIVVAINTADGSPVTGLAADDFGITALSATNGAPVARSGAASVNEPMPGVYVLTLDRSIASRSRGPFACVIDIQANGSRSSAGDRTRVLVPIGR